MVVVGPYAPAILRFQISFPPGYPESPPNVTFTTDIFHPLVTPLTTYTYTTGSSDTDPVSATDEERLPTGGFSLRHGFPFWFQRAKKSAANSACSSRNVSGSHAQNDQAQPQSATGLAEPGSATPATSRSLSASKSTPAGSPLPSPGQSTNDVTVAEVLQYVRSAFSDEVLLDSLPLEAAGNPGAWHAWRAHRRRTGHLPSVSAHGRGPDGTLPGSDSDATIASGQDTPTRNLTRKRLKAVPKQPGEWNWEGVWEERVRKGVEASQSEAVLYGNAGGRDELVSWQTTVLGGRWLI